MPDSNPELCPSGWKTPDLAHCPRGFPGCNCSDVLTIDKPGDPDYVIVAEWAGLPTDKDLFDMNSVWVVVCGEDQPIGVFSTEEKANECIKLGMETNRWDGWHPEVFPYLLDDSWGATTSAQPSELPF